MGLKSQTLLARLNAVKDEAERKFNSLLAECDKKIREGVAVAREVQTAKDEIVESIGKIQTEIRRRQ